MSDFLVCLMNSDSDGALALVSDSFFIGAGSPRM